VLCSTLWSTLREWSTSELRWYASFFDTKGRAMGSRIYRVLAPSTLIISGFVFTIAVDQGQKRR
jgi:hypothetical protein